jgi:hypothetical protein
VTRAPTAEREETVVAPAVEARRPVSRRTLLELVGVGTLCVIAVAIHWGSMGQALVEEHGFRQTQTAYQALEFKEQGIDLLHPKLPVLGKPFEVPFEFPAFQAIATIPMDLGIATDTSMRLTGLGCFLLTGCLLFGLLRRV